VTMIPPVAIPTTNAVMPIPTQKIGKPKTFLLQFIFPYLLDTTFFSSSVPGLEKTSGEESNGISNPVAGTTSMPPIEKWGFLDHEFLGDIFQKRNFQILLLKPNINRHQNIEWSYGRANIYGAT
jgi:hypothetical protein